LHGKGRIIGQLQSTEAHRQTVDIVELKPVVAAEGRSHPLSDAEAGSRAQDCGSSIGSAGSGAAEQAPEPACLAEGQVAHLEAELHRIEQLAAGVKQINAATAAIDGPANVEIDF